MSSLRVDRNLRTTPSDPLTTIRDVVLQVQRMLRRGERSRAALTALASVGVAGGLAMAADRLVYLPATVRWLLTATVGIAALLPFVLGRRRWSAEAAAQHVEDALPELDEQLVTVWELRFGPPDRSYRPSPELLSAVEASVAETLSKSPLRHLAGSRARGAGVAAGLCVALHAAVACSVPSTYASLAKRLVLPHSSTARPTTVDLEIAPFANRLAVGDDLHLTVLVQKGEPRRIDITWRRDDNSAERREPLTSSDGGRTYARTFHALTSTLRFALSAGDYVSSWYEVVVRAPPRPREFSISYRPPRYARRSPSTVTSKSGALAYLDGTEIALQIEATEPLRQAEVIWMASALDTSGSPVTLEVGREHSKAAVLQAADGHSGLPAAP